MAASKTKTRTNKYNMWLTPKYKKYTSINKGEISKLQIYRVNYFQN